MYTTSYEAKDLAMNGRKFPVSQLTFKLRCISFQITDKSTGAGATRFEKAWIKTAATRGKGWILLICRFIVGVVFKAVILD